jgi:DNA-directed RNA polymerase subunit F
MGSVSLKIPKRRLITCSGLAYVSTFSKLDAESARKLKQELIERFGLEEVEAVQVVNICPKTVEEVRTVLSGYKRLLLTVLADEEKLKGMVLSSSFRFMKTEQTGR